MNMVEALTCFIHACYDMGLIPSLNIRLLNSLSKNHRFMGVNMYQKGSKSSLNTKKWSKIAVFEGQFEEKKIKSDHEIYILNFGVVSVLCEFSTWHILLG